MYVWYRQKPTGYVYIYLFLLEIFGPIFILLWSSVTPKLRLLYLIGTAREWGIIGGYWVHSIKSDWNMCTMHDI